MRKAIPQTLLELEREGVLSPGQRAAVEARLAAALSRKGDGAGRFVSIVAALGGVLVGAGILYLVGYNWDELAKGDKLAILFGTWFAAHYAGFHLSERPGRYPRVGRALTAVGILCFGGAIGLVAQIYNLTSEYPNSVLAWWALSVPFVLLTSSRAILLVVAALFLTWILWHTGVHVEHLGGHRDLEHAAALALLGPGIAGLFGALGGLASGSRWSRLEPVLAGLARPAAIAGVYALSLKVVWGPFDDGDRIFSNLEGGVRGGLLVPFACLCGASLVVLAVTAVRDRRGGRALEPLAFLAPGLLLGAMLAGRPEGVSLVANLVLLAGILALLASGIRRGRASDVNWGIATFVLCMATRYVEYLWNKLQGAYAFIGIGVLLLGVGWVLERQRRRWIALSARRSG